MTAFTSTSGGGGARLGMSLGELLEAWRDKRYRVYCYFEQAFSMHVSAGDVTAFVELVSDAFVVVNIEFDVTADTTLDGDPVADLTVADVAAIPGAHGDGFTTDEDFPCWHVGDTTYFFEYGELTEIMLGVPFAADVDPTALVTAAEEAEEAATLERARARILQALLAPTS